MKILNTVEISHFNAYHTNYVIDVYRKVLTTLKEVNNGVMIWMVIEQVLTTLNEIDFSLNYIPSIMFGFIIFSSLAV